MHEQKGKYMSDKKKIAVLFGGQSSEHEISCMSAANVTDCIDTEQFEIYRVGITEQGKWLLASSTEDIRSGAWRNSGTGVVLSPDAATHGMYLLNGSTGAMTQVIRLDVVFPVLHGLYGEDGTVQGLLEMAHIPYVGCGVFASAAGMDKFFTKVIVNSIGIRQAKFVGIYKFELGDMDTACEKVEKEIPYPVFVKPSRAGSSKGVSKANNRVELEKALVLAAQHDSKILVEETIVGRELECAVYGNRDILASHVGEICATAEFYDFDAKYHDETSRTDTDPELPEGVEDEIRQSARKIFRALGGSGLSRVDFFLDKDGVVFNEINTLPGFTAISMYPMLMEKMGMEKHVLIRNLIELATKERF